MTWAEHLVWLDNLPKDKFYTAKWLYEKLGHERYKRIWEKNQK